MIHRKRQSNPMLNREARRFNAYGLAFRNRSNGSVTKAEQNILPFSHKIRVNAPVKRGFQER